MKGLAGDHIGYIGFLQSEASRSRALCLAWGLRLYVRVWGLSA